MLRRLFLTFVKAGVSAFGGGYVMIPIIERAVVDRYQWIDRDTYVNIVTVAQSTPGVFAINLSTAIGYSLKGTKGAVTAAFATALPSFLIILAIAAVWRHCHEMPLVQAAFRGIRPATVALLTVPLLSLARSAKMTWRTVWIPLVGALLIWQLGVNPIFIILVAIAAGLFTPTARRS